MAIYKTQITNLQIKPKKQGANSICCSEPHPPQFAALWDRDFD